MSRSRVVRCVGAVGLLAVAVALVLVLLGGNGERPVGVARQDDDGQSDLPRRVTPPDPSLSAALAIPPDTYPTERFFDVREALERANPVVIDPRVDEAEPEQEPVTFGAPASGWTDTASAVVLVLFANHLLRRARRRSASRTSPAPRQPALR